jgi:hypothetical protein
MKDNGENKQRPRSSIRLCEEVSRFIREEQTRRKTLGLPHTTQNDIVNDWLREHAQSLAFAARGYSSYPVAPFTQLYPSNPQQGRAPTLDELNRMGVDTGFPQEYFDAARRAAAPKPPEDGSE